jgi:hypothetical protein
MSDYVYRLFRGRTTEDKLRFLSVAKGEGLEYVEGLFGDAKPATVLDDGAKVLFRVVGVPATLSGPRISVQHNGRIIHEVPWNPKGDDVLSFCIVGRDDLFATLSWSESGEHAAPRPERSEYEILGKQDGWTGSQSAAEVGAVAEAVWRWCEKEKDHEVVGLVMIPQAVRVKTRSSAVFVRLASLREAVSAAFREARENPERTPVGMWFKRSFPDVQGPPEQEEILEDRRKMCTEIVDGALRWTGSDLTEREKTARQVAINWCDSAALYACGSEYWEKRAREAEARRDAGASRAETLPAPPPEAKAPEELDALKLRIQKQFEDALAPFVGKDVTDELRKRMTDAASRVLDMVSNFSIEVPTEEFLDEVCEWMVATREELEAWAEHCKVFPGTSPDDFIATLRAKRAGLEKKETAGFMLVRR